MNRCLKNPLLRFAAVLLAVAAGTSAGLPAPAAAQTVQRNIPKAAKHGLLVVTTPPQVLLDGRAERLSPGARIRGSNNLLVLSASLTGRELPVRYVRDSLGLLHEVWLLSEAEAREMP